MTAVDVLRRRRRYPIAVPVFVIVVVVIAALIAARIDPTVVLALVGAAATVAVQLTRPRRRKI